MGENKFKSILSGCLGLLIIAVINLPILFLVAKLIFNVSFGSFMSFIKDLSLVNWLLQMSSGLLFLLGSLFVFIIFQIIRFIVMKFSEEND